MRLRTAVIAAVACIALAVPSSALAISPTQDAYSGIAGQQEGGNGSPTSTSPVVSAESSGGDGEVEPVSTSGSGTLPFTGLELGLIAVAGIALLGGGLALYRISRNRPEFQG